MFGTILRAVFDLQSTERGVLAHKSLLKNIIVDHM